MKVLTPDVQPIGTTKAVLGESVCWSPDDGSVLWVDIVGRKVLRTALSDGRTEEWSFPEQTGFVQPADDGTWLVGQENSILVLDPRTGTREKFVDLEAGDRSTRTNDAGCDPQGKLLVGTMRMGDLQPVGSLYRIDAAHRIETLDRDLTIPNGIAFSPDGTTAYWADTFVKIRQVWRASCTAASGALGPKEPFVQIDEQRGRPDGAAIDEDGFYWVAAAWGWQLLRYAPDGRLDRAVRLPVQRPSKLAFGGPKLSTIFVTSISEGLGEDAEETQPLAGRLIALDLGIRGLPPRLFGAAKR